MRGWVRFQHTTRLFMNWMLPNSNKQLITPKGDKLLPVPDLTLMLPAFCISVVGKHW